MDLRTQAEVVGDFFVVISNSISGEFKWALKRGALVDLHDLLRGGVLVCTKDLEVDFGRNAVGKSDI